MFRKRFRSHIRGHNHNHVPEIGFASGVVRHGAVIHDLKHQIRELRNLSDDQEREVYLDELENDIMIYDTALQTGNRALDIVLMEKALYCKNHGINWTCMADGSKLGMMKVEDIYAIFGNALENAIHAVMDLKDENRILVKEGLRMLQDPENEGLKALIRVNNLENREISAYHIGFVIGPCMNASGRLSTAKRALKLLLAEDPSEAATLAQDLKDLNDSRKDMTAKGVEEAVEMVEHTDLKNDRVLVIYLPDCHESLAGIIAGRVRERYVRPVFVLTKGEGGVKGSGRSIEAYHMFQELVKCKELLTKFGGHPMAAGLSLPEENVEAFRRKLNENCTLTQDDMTEKIVIDVPMPMSYVTIPLIRQLSLLEPFGKGNTKPVFAQKDMKVLNFRVLGKNRNVVKMNLTDDYGFRAEGIWFGDGDAFASRLQEKEKWDMIYYPSINSYMGRDSIEMVIQNIR